MVKDSLSHSCKKKAPLAKTYMVKCSTHLPLLQIILEKKNNLNGKNLIRVDTVVFDGTEYLEHIVTKHYGEHDMVYRVL